MCKTGTVGKAGKSYYLPSELIRIKSSFASEYLGTRKQLMLAGCAVKYEPRGKKKNTFPPRFSCKSV